MPPAVVCCYNFTPNVVDGFTVGLPTPGTLIELLNSDDERFGGKAIAHDTTIEIKDIPFADQPYSAQLILPPLSAVFFEYKMIPVPTLEPDQDDSEERE